MAYIKANPPSINFSSDTFNEIRCDLEQLGLEYTTNHDLFTNYLMSPNPYLIITFVFNSTEELNLYKLTGTTLQHIAKDPVKHIDITGAFRIAVKK